MSDATALAHSFSRSATAYDSAAVVQRQIAKRLVLAADQTFRPRTILDLGAGTGFLTSELQRFYPDAEIDAVDISAGMIERCRQSVRYGGAVRMHHADARSFEPGRKFELIATSSALQWMQPLRQTLTHFHSLTARSGRMIGAVMLASTLGELRTLRRELFPEKPVNEILPRSNELVKSLDAAGFSLRNYFEDWHREEYSSARALLEHVSAVGISGPVEIGSRELLTRAELLLLCGQYDTRHRTASGVAATYHIGYFEAERLPN